MRKNFILQCLGAACLTVAAPAWAQAPDSILNRLKQDPVTRSIRS